ncbi:MAG: hypothetical protein ACRCYP_01860 [Alphaproteobacteria bacterium]
MDRYAKSDLQAHTTYNSETKEETWTQILFYSENEGPNAPLLCYEVDKMGCTKIEGQFQGKDDAGLDIYSYIVHFEDGDEREIITTFSVR